MATPFFCDLLRSTYYSQRWELSIYYSQGFPIGGGAQRVIELEADLVIQACLAPPLCVISDTPDRRMTEGRCRIWDL